MLYYTLRNGKIVDEYDLKKAYEIVSGKMFIDDAVGYSKFLYGLCGGSVVKAMNESDVSIEELTTEMPLSRRYGCTVKRMVAA